MEYLQRLTARHVQYGAHKPLPPGFSRLVSRSAPACIPAKSRYVTTVTLVECSQYRFPCESSRRKQRGSSLQHGQGPCCGLGADLPRSRPPRNQRALRTSCVFLLCNDERGLGQIMSVANATQNQQPIWLITFEADRRRPDAAKHGESKCVCPEADPSGSSRV